MRIAQPQRRDQSWLVYAQPGEFYGNTEDVLIGSVTPRGRLEVAKYRFRGDRFRSAQLRLEDARRTLVSGGHIRDRDLERTIADEARTGSFIVELDSGEERRFYSLAPEAGRRTTAPRYDRPSAREWAEEALQSGRATHADLFRHSSSQEPERDTIFVPHILPARTTDARNIDGFCSSCHASPGVRAARCSTCMCLPYPRVEHPLLVVGEYEQLPLDSWSTRDRSRFIRRECPREVQRAYEAKKHAMDLVIARYLHIADQRRKGPLVPSSADIADAWGVTEDAFLEARLPLQVAFARANFRYWQDIGGTGRSRRS